MEYRLDRTFPLRLIHFVESVTTCDCPGEEEKEYLLMCGREALKQLVKQGEYNAEVKAYLDNCRDMIASQLRQVNR